MRRLLSIGVIVTGWITLAVVWGVMAWVAYWLSVPMVGLTLTPNPFAVESKIVPAGTLATYTVSYCVDTHLPLPITVNRELELMHPESSYPIAPPLTYTITSRCETRRFLLGIASYIPQGTYHLIWRTSLSVNPLRTVQQVFESEPFEVVK